VLPTAAFAKEFQRAQRGPEATADDAGGKATRNRWRRTWRETRSTWPGVTQAQALVATGGDTAIAILTVTGNPALQVLAI